jgi:uncharacterized protein involved in exopolysaccharide biosynthesis
MGRRRQGNSTPQKNNNSIEDLLGNEGNEYLIPDPKRKIINMANELKEELKNEYSEIIREKLQEKVKENIQNQLKEYQDTTNKKLEKIQKQLNELRKGFNKLQNETKKTSRKQTCEIKTAQDMKEDFNKDMENLKKKRIQQKS